MLTKPLVRRAMTNSALVYGGMYNNFFILAVRQTDKTFVSTKVFLDYIK
jgi:hypothetical protein